MAILLNNVTTTDKYSDNEIQVPNAVGLSILVANKAVLAQFKRVPSGNSNESTWTDDVLLTPQTAQYHNVSGFRVKSAISGSPAQVVAVLSEPSDPQALGASPYTASLAASGVVTPGAQSVKLSYNGAIIGTEPEVDFVDASGKGFALADDTVNQRITVNPSGFWQKLDDVTLGAAGAFSLTVPSSHKYGALKVLGFIRTNSGATNERGVLRFNHDNGSSAYIWNESVIQSGSFVDNALGGTSYIAMGQVVASGGAGGVFSVVDITIMPGPAGSSFKLVSGTTQFVSTPLHSLFSGSWNNGGDLTSIQLEGFATANLASGSRAMLLGCI